MFSFFKKKELSSLVKQKANTGYKFVDAFDDLGEFIDRNPNCKPIIKMSYWYARRTCGAAFYLQGFWSYDKFEYTQNMFKISQIECGVAREFQELALKLSNEFLYKYHPSWQGVHFSILTSLAIDGFEPLASDGYHVTDEALKEMVFMMLLDMNKPKVVSSNREIINQYKEQLEDINDSEEPKTLKFSLQATGKSDWSMYVLSSEDESGEVYEIISLLKNELQKNHESSLVAICMNN